ncbi:MAG: hypothetical protein ACFB16_04635 [Phormidesmis sp.]
MKSTTIKTSRRMLTQLQQRLQLAKTLEGTYGADVTSAHYQEADCRAGWSTQQLLALSAAKSLYN